MSVQIAVEPAASSALELNIEHVRVPMLPQVAIKLMAMVDDAKADASKLSELIFGDPAIAAHVLRVANSAAIGGRFQVTNLQQAITRLGRRILREVAVIASVAENVFKIEGRQVEAMRMWQIAVETGAWCREIARLRGGDTEGSFVCGLLMDIGRPVIFAEACAYAENHRIPLGSALLEATIERYSTQAGLRIAEEWLLPDRVISCIRWGKTPHLAEQHQEDVLMACAARRFANTDREDRKTPEFWDHPLHDALDMEPRAVRAVLRCEDAILEAVAAMSF